MYESLWSRVDHFSVYYKENSLYSSFCHKVLLGYHPLSFQAPALHRHCSRHCLFPFFISTSPNYLSKYIQVNFTVEETCHYPHWFQNTPWRCHGSSHLNTYQYDLWSQETTSLWQTQKVRGETWTKVKPFLHHNQLPWRRTCELSKRNWPSQKILTVPQLCPRHWGEQQGTRITYTWFLLSRNYTRACGRPRGHLQLSYSEKGLVPGTLRRLVSGGRTGSQTHPEPQCMVHKTFSTCSKPTAQGTDSWMDVPMWEQRKEAGGVRGHPLEQCARGGIVVGGNGVGLAGLREHWDTVTGACRRPASGQTVLPDHVSKTTFVMELGHLPSGCWLRRCRSLAMCYTRKLTRLWLDDEDRLAWIWTRRVTFMTYELL